MRLAIAAAAIAAFTGPAFAQSSGNFAAMVTTAKCDMNEKGVLTPPANSVLKTTIQTPNAGSTALVIRPSLVTGLYTKTTVTKLSPEASATAGIQVRVLLDGKAVAPGSNYGKAAGPNDGWVYYDERYQQLSTNIFTAIDTDTSSCTDPATGVTEPCYFSLVLSTLSAHSLDFVASNVGQGTHNIEVQWRFDPVTAEAGNEAACVGQSVVTVEQVKAFSTGGGIQQALVPRPLQRGPGANSGRAPAPSRSRLCNGVARLSRFYSQYSHLPAART